MRCLTGANSHKTARGFTLMELLISIAIFLIITAMVIVNFHSGRYRDELVGGAEAISTSIREMQTATSAGDVVECVAGVPEPPAGGFGVNLTLANSLITFGDCEGSTADYEFDALDSEVKTVSWSVNAPITSLDVDSAVSSPMDIIFSANAETVRLNGANDKISGIITLTHSKTGRQAEVRVNAITGQVFITYL